MKRVKNLVAVLLLGFSGVAMGECSVSVTPINFGVYYPTAGATSDANIAISCTSVVIYNIKLDAGYSGTFYPREMHSTSGPSTLAYNLYEDPGYVFVWGDGSNGTVTVSGNGIGSGTAYHTINGIIPADQNVPEGVYTDAISVWVEW